MSVVLVAFPTTDAEVLLDAYDVRVTADGGTEEPAARSCALASLAEILGESLGVEVDTESDIDVALTFSIQDIQDPTKRRGTFSKTVTLPGTSNNHALFGHAYNLQSYFSGFDPTRRIRCSLWVDGIQVFTGIMQLLKIKKSGQDVRYEVSLYSDEVSLFRDIEGKLLTDLDLSDLNHALTSGVVSGTWSAAQGSGYVYPMYDGGDYTDRVTASGSTLANVFGVENFKPAVYVKEYIDRIFASAGYRYSSDFFDSARFKSLVIPYFANGRLLLNISQALDEAARVQSTLQSSSGIIEFDDDSSTGFYDNGSNFDTTAFTYTAPLTGDYLIYLNALVNNDDVVSRGAQLFISVNDNIVAFSPFLDIPATTSYAAVLNQTLSLEAGDIVTFPYSAGSGISILAGANVRITPATASATIGQQMFMNDAIPVKIKQSELLTDLIKMFNLMVYASPNDPKELIIETWPDFYASGAVDWSLKVDEISVFDIEAGDPDSRKTYQFNFADGGDLFSRTYLEEFNQGYGSRKYTVDSYYAKNTVVVETLCAPCIPAQYNTERAIFRSFDLDNNGNAKTITTGYRIGQYSFVSPPSGTFWLYEGTAQVSGYPYIGHIDNPYTPTFDLTFGIPLKVYYNALNVSGTTQYTNNNLFNLYWRNYIDELISPESMQVELTVILSPIDIALLDFRQIVYIHGTYWRLLEIRDYVAGKTEPCRILLRRVLNTLPFTGGAFTVEPGYTTTPRDGEQVPTISPPFNTTT